MSTTGHVGMVGQRPKVIIKPAPAIDPKTGLTAEQKAKERLEKRIKASEEKCQKND